MIWTILSRSSMNFSLIQSSVLDSQPLESSTFVFFFCSASSSALSPLSLTSLSLVSFCFSTSLSVSSSSFLTSSRIFVSRSDFFVPSFFSSSSWSLVQSERCLSTSVRTPSRLPVWSFVLDRTSLSTWRLCLSWDVRVSWVFFSRPLPMSWRPSLRGLLELRLALVLGHFRGRFGRHRTGTRTAAADLRPAALLGRHLPLEPFLRRVRVDLVLAHLATGVVGAGLGGLLALVVGVAALLRRPSRRPGPSCRRPARSRSAPPSWPRPWWAYRRTGRPGPPPSHRSRASRRVPPMA